MLTPISRQVHESLNPAKVLIQVGRGAGQVDSLYATLNYGSSRQLAADAKKSRFDTQDARGVSRRRVEEPAPTTSSTSCSRRRSGPAWRRQRCRRRDEQDLPGIIATIIKCSIVNRATERRRLISFIDWRFSGVASFAGIGADKSHAAGEAFWAAARRWMVDEEAAEAGMTNLRVL